jgi:pimeloyl-ACP methyl ester carboxylesterase
VGGVLTLLANIDEKTFRGAEATLNYAESATEGPPLLLLHGSSFRWQTFSSLIPALCQRWHLYALDFRGHGKSSHGFATYRYQHLVDDVVEFVAECIGKPTVIYGYSLGGAVGFAAAARLGALAQRMIIADNFLYHDSMLEIQAQPLLQSMFRGVQRIAGQQTPDATLPLLSEIKLPVNGDEITVGDLFAGNPGFLEMWAECVSQLDPKVLEIFFTPLTREEFNGDRMLREISCPIVIFQANPALGGIMPDRDVERVLSVRPEAAVHRFHLGHMMHMENPEPIISVVQTLRDL